jgi:hypothetical protein
LADRDIGRSRDRDDRAPGAWHRTESQEGFADRRMRDDGGSVLAKIAAPAIRVLDESR